MRFVITVPLNRPWMFGFPIVTEKVIFSPHDVTINQQNDLLHRLFISSFKFSTGNTHRTTISVLGAC